jgi:excisionase family DNA binding protein
LTSLGDFGYRPAQDDSARGGTSVPNDNHETLKVREVAAILRCGRNQAYELIQRGEIRSVRIGRAIRVTREALDEFKAGREAAVRAR